MKAINLAQIFAEKYPGYWQRKSKLTKKIILKFLGKLIHINEANEFLSKSGDKKGISFIEEIFEYLNFSFSLSDKDIQKIPSEGRLVIVANHPLGGLDGLALIKAVSNVRSDVKIIGNDVLSYITNLKELILPFTIEGKKLQRENIRKIGASLENEEAVIIFPAAEVSRMKFFTIKDNKWMKGATFFAEKYNSPVLPVFVEARNSFMFYLISGINKFFSRFLLPHELFSKRNKTINIKIGDPIPEKAFKGYLNSSTQIKLLKKHVYKIGKGKTGLFKVEKNIIHPVDKKLLKTEINQSHYLGSTKDEKKIILTDFDSSPSLMKEIGRLREITFRSVGEGTGNKIDFDIYDKYYKHLIVWDDKELEIVGSYRVGLGSDIYKNYGIKGFYTSTLFDYSENFITDIVLNSLELGRSFVQKKYWNTNALNYLWQGLGAYIAQAPDVKYLFGAVSISNNYPEEAKKRIVYFYNKWFGSVNDLAKSKNKFLIPEKDIQILSEQFNGKDYKEDFRILKNSLKPLGFTVPVLFKHYSDLCNDDGVRFLDFGVDDTFENCIDGLIVLDVDKIKEEKKERYINRYKVIEAEI